LTRHVRAAAGAGVVPAPVLRVPRRPPGRASATSPQ